MVATFRMWQLHIREVEQRTEEATGQGTKRTGAGRWRIGCESPASRHDSLTHCISVIQVQTVLRSTEDGDGSGLCQQSAWWHARAAGLPVMVTSPTPSGRSRPIWTGPLTGSCSPTTSH
jgi:hypothetical protein